MMSLIDLGKQLLEAAKLGLTDQVRLLMSNGAPFTTDWLGNSALHFTAQYGHLDTSEALMRAGISRDARTKVDRTPLHLASQEGHLALVSLLITNGADVNAVDMLRMTPLHWAVEKGHTDVVQFLLNHGAAVNAANKFSKTPVDIAYCNDRNDLIILMQNSLIGSAAAAEETNEGVVEEVVDSTSSAVLSTDSVLECESSSAPAISVLDCSDQRLLISDSGDGLLDPSVSPSSHRLSTSKSKAASTGKQRHNRRLATLADLAEATSSSSSSKSQSTMSATDTLSWLETHGVVLADQSNMFTSMLESGQMVVLTEAGNLILNTACNLSDSGDVSVHDDTTVTLSADAVLTDCDQNDTCASSLHADDYTHDVQQSVQQSYSRKRKSAGNLELDSHLAHIASDSISDEFNSKVTKLHAVNS